MLPLNSYRLEGFSRKEEWPEDSEKERRRRREGGAEIGESFGGTFRHQIFTRGQASKLLWQPANAFA